MNIKHVALGTIILFVLMCVFSCDSKTSKSDGPDGSDESIGLQSYFQDTDSINPTVSRSAFSLKRNSVDLPLYSTRTSTDVLDYFDRMWKYGTTASPSENILDKVFNPDQVSFSYQWCVQALDKEINTINDLVTENHELQPSHSDNYKLTLLTEKSSPAAFFDNVIVTFDESKQGVRAETIPVQGVVEFIGDIPSNFVVMEWKAAFYKDENYERVLVYNKAANTSTPDELSVSIFYGVKDKVNKLTYVRYVTSKKRKADASDTAYSELVVFSNELSIDTETADFSLALGWSLGYKDQAWAAECTSVFGGGNGTSNTILRRRAETRTAETTADINGEEWFIMDKTLQPLDGNVVSKTDVTFPGTLPLAADMKSVAGWNSAYDALAQYAHEDRRVKTTAYSNVMIENWD